MQNVQVKPQHTQALQNVFFVFLILSYMPATKHFIGTPVTHWRLRLKQDNWVTMTYLGHVTIVTARDG